MTAKEFTKVMREMDVVVWAENGDIKVNSPGPIDSQLLNYLKAHKSAAVDILSGDEGKVKGSTCDCGSDLYITDAFLWWDLKNRPRSGYQCTGCGTRYSFVKKIDDCKVCGSNGSAFIA